MSPAPYAHKAQYYETDQMGVVHHSNHIRWLEEARVDWLEQMGLSYRRLEESGISIPVLHVACSYLRVVRFGDTVHIRLWVETLKNARMAIGYELCSPAGDVLYATASTGHCFINSAGHPVALARAQPAYYAALAGSMAQNNAKERSKERPGVKTAGDVCIGHPAQV